MTDKHDYSLLGHNTFGFDVTCSRFLEYSSVDEARQVAREITSTKGRLLIIGSGSDLLLTGDFKGTVVHSKVRGVDIAGDDGSDGVLVKCGSGEVWDDVVAWSLKNHLYGAENLSIIPGEVGASAVQNIGAYGAEVMELIASVEAVEISTGDVRHFSNKDCQYSYRQSRFKHDWHDKFLITHVTYRLSRTFSPKLDYGNIRAALRDMNIAEPSPEDVRKAIIAIRNAKLPDPKVQGNAGSFFMNPIVDKKTFERLHNQFASLRYFEIPSPDGSPSKYKIPAGWMIEQCGWKGRSLGRAGVHDKQALVLVNNGGATGADVVRLMHAIQHDVKMKFGLELQPEVNVV